MSGRAPKLSFLVLLVVLMAAFGFIIKPFLLPAIFALVIAIICNPVYRFLLKKCRNRRHLAAFIATLAVILCVIIPMGLIIGVIISKSIGLVSAIIAQLEGGSIASAIENANRWIVEKSANYPYFAPEWFNLKVILIDFFKSASVIIYQYSPRVFSATAGILGNLFLLIVFIFVFFSEGSSIYKTLMLILPLDNRHKEILAKEVEGVVSGTFLGMIATAFAQAFLIGIGFWIAGISNPFVWGLIAIGVTLVPVIGGPLMYVPAAASLFILGHWGSGIFILLYGTFVVSMVDNIIKPLILRGKVKINAVLLALSMIGGVFWLGPAGIIVGPLVVVLMMAMIRIYKREFV